MSESFRSGRLSGMSSRLIPISAALRLPKSSSSSLLFQFWLDEEVVCWKMFEEFVAAFVSTWMISSSDEPWEYWTSLMTYWSWSWSWLAETPDEDWVLEIALFWKPGLDLSKRDTSWAGRYFSSVEEVLSPSHWYWRKFGDGSGVEITLAEELWWAGEIWLGFDSVMDWSLL